MMRRLAVLIVAFLLAIQVVRTAVVERAAPRSTIGAWMWANHPAVITDRAMAEIGASARRGEELSRATIQLVEDIAERSPLAVEPFLIHGAVAQMKGDDAKAEKLFEEARNRDPRSEAARYFLADRYLRSGRTAEALPEMAIFSRLVPTATERFAPALANYARTPGTVPQMRRFFRTSPEFEPIILSQLAADPSNADLILSLASASGTQQPWQGQLVQALVDQRQYAKARAVWGKVGGVSTSSNTIFNPAFEDSPAPPPFNWVFSISGGVAEPAGNGRLQVIYYGRQDVVLARQLVLLAPGPYILRMQVNGQPGDGSAVSWAVTCLSTNSAILSLPLRQAERTAEATFAVPADCPAQRLELVGSAGEFPQTIDFTIGNLELARKAGQ